jgi:hypothetical protein
MMNKRAKLTGKGKGGRHYQVPQIIYDSPAYLSLSCLAFKLWHDLLTQYNGYNNGEICAVVSQMKVRGWAESSLHKALRELIGKGFLVRNSQGGIGPAGKKPSRYRFTHLPADAPQFDCPKTGPTNEYRQWRPQ